MNKLSVTQTPSTGASIFLNDEAPVPTVAPSPEIAAYQAHGWKLCSINGKDAHTSGWNKPGHELQGMPLPGNGVGLCHAFSGTAAIDIDDMDLALALLAARGVDLNALLNAPDAVQIVSREGRGKLLYSLPTPRPTKTVREGKVMVLELRCGTKSGNTMQDVLPPSIHPVTNQPYTWGGEGDWRSLPPMPQGLLSLWDELASPEAPVRKFISSVQMPLAPIREALAAIDPDAEGYEGWLKGGMALFEEGDHLYDEFINWSSRSAWWDLAECEDKWSSFGRGSPGNITIATLGFMARKAAWQEPIDWTNVVKVRKDEEAKEAETATGNRNVLGIFTPDETYMLDNIYTLKEGKSAYFDKSDGASFGSAARLDAAYGKLALGPSDKTKPSTWLAQQNDSKVVMGQAWSPEDSAIVILDGQAYVNMYRPMKIEPKENIDLIRNWLTLSRFIYGRHFKVAMQVLAHTIRNPMVKIKWGVAVVGKPRTGKDMSLKPMEIILGSAFGPIDPEDAQQAWGDHFKQKRFIVFQETANEGPAWFNKTKNKLANDYIESLNVKSAAMEKQRCLYTIFFLSNNIGCISFDEDQDKILVIKSPDKRKSDEFYAETATDMEKDGFKEAVYHYLLNVDLSDFTPGRMPERTEAMYEMVRKSKGDMYKAIRDAAETRNKPFHIHMVELSTLAPWVEKEEFLGAFKRTTAVKAMEEAGWTKHRGSKSLNGKSEFTSRFYAPEAECEGMKAKDLFAYYHMETTDEAVITAADKVDMLRKLKVNRLNIATKKAAELVLKSSSEFT